MECREGCAACCISPSIVQPIPNMPNGKPSGVPCENLDIDTLRCRIWGQGNYPSFCKAFKPEPEFCGSNREEALHILEIMERTTKKQTL